MAKKNGHPVDEWQKEKDEIIAYMPNLRAFAISLVRDGNRADDLVQETVLRALTHIESFQKNTNLSAWLFTILKNLSLSDYRKRRREVEDYIGVDDKGQEISHSSFLKTQPDVESSNEFERLCMSIACLPREQADAIVAVGYLGLDYNDVCEILGCAQGTVKSRTNRARTKLAELLVEGEMVKVDIEPLKYATRGVPKSHPYYVIAQAYEDMFAELESIGFSNGNAIPPISKKEQMWNDLVKSGALDELQEHTPDFMIDGRFEK